MTDHGYFEELIKTALIGNPHSAEVELQARAGLLTPAAPHTSLQSIRPRAEDLLKHRSSLIRGAALDTHERGEHTSDTALRTHLEEQLIFWETLRWEHY